MSRLLYVPDNFMFPTGGRVGAHRDEAGQQRGRGALHDAPSADAFGGAPGVLPHEAPSTMLPRCYFKRGIPACFPTRRPPPCSR